MTENLDQAQNLEHAMHVFWQHGYEGTNFNQLVAATGLSRKAIYKNWQDKRGLFVNCLTFYSDQMATLMLAPLVAPQTAGLPALLDFFTQFKQMLCTDTPLYGCLVVKTVAEIDQQDVEITNITQDFLQQVKNSIHHSLIAAQKHQQIHSNININQATVFLFAIHTAFGSLSGNHASRALLIPMVTQALVYLDQLKRQNHAH